MTITLTDLLKQEVEGAYHATEGLFKLVDKDKLGWKPATGKNWMTTGQVLHHLTNACGFCVKGFVTGDWGMPAGAKPEDMKPEDMLPPAEKLPTVKSVDEALKLLADDKKTALKFIAEAGEKNLLTKTLTAPWGGPPMTLFQHIDHMIGHQGQHKAQLFYYLKLQGKDVNTGNLWGM
ncbi:MAG: DinB family protein [Planctomycetes bacterium]|nr:DinB family protein [Planctomycetota bacterium]